MTESLLHILARRVREQPDRLAYRFMADGTSESAVDWSYGDVGAHASSVADDLRARGLAGRGARVMIALDPGLDYVAAIYGVLLAGAVAVPALPPDGRRTMARFRTIVGDCRPELILAGERFAQRRDEFEAGLVADVSPPEWRFDGYTASTAALFEMRPASYGGMEGAALLQYTSGSTGEPKGIVLTHANLISNCTALDRHTRPESCRVGCSWLPPYHDMGLMGTIMFSLYGGWPLVMFSPVHFVQQPVRWLRALTEHGVTISVAPNFAFDLCTDHIADDELSGLDMSALRQLFCGSEPVRLGTLERFRKRFEPFGYSAHAMIPCYGLAEATLFVSGKTVETPVRSASISRPTLEAGTVSLAAPESSQSTAIVSCGVVADGHELVIADADGHRLGPNAVGEIWVHGPSVAMGYHNRPELTAATFGARLSEAHDDHLYLRTGDLGFVLEGELFVVGRIKDIVIIAGRNLYLQDVERTVREAHAQVRLAVSFAVDEGEEEHLVVVAEYRGAAHALATEAAEVQASILAGVVAEHGIRPADIHLAPVGAIQTTTSGKLRRRATRDLYLAGNLKSFTLDEADPALVG